MQVMLPKTTPEQRHPYYSDVEALLDFGFLSHMLTVNGVAVAIRSLGPGDIFMLRHRVAMSGDEEWKVWMIASSMWMINGHCLLGNAEAVPRMAQTVRRLPKHIREILFSLAMGLFHRQSKAIEVTEAFCYESTSRYKWKAFGKHLPSAHAGVPGVEHLGTNYTQRMWSFYNTIEDQKILDSSTWDGFKLATSPHAPKGIKKIDEADKQHKQQEQDRRQEIQDRAYYVQRGLLQEIRVKDKKSKEDSFAVGTKSADDLVEEMHRWVTGEDDLHDKIVNDYKQRVVTNYEVHKTEQEERAAALRAMQEQDSDMPVALVGYTPEQLDAIIKERGPGTAAGVRRVEGGMNGVREYLYQKYLGNAPDAGALQPTEDGRLVIGVAGDEYPVDGESLDSLIAQRKVAFDSGPALPDMEY